MFQEILAAGEDGIARQFVNRVGMTSLLAGMLFLVGCGGGTDGPPMYEVSGTVTYDGEPLETGRVTFRRTEGDGKAFAGEIKNGKYSLETEEGNYAVSIIASRIIPGKFDTANGTPEPVGEMYIPTKYNDQTELTAEVSSSSEKTINFDLTSN